MFCFLDFRKLQIDTRKSSPYCLRMENTSFETALKDLEKTVSFLEKGDTPLEDQLKAFEKGVAMSRECMKKLEEVEKKVEILMQESNGKLTAAPFEC